MGRGNKQIEGQLSFDFCLDTRKYVVAANTLITGKHTLKLNSTKLIRCAIMQIEKDDKELKPYIVTVKELANFLGVSESNLYRDVESITDDITRNPVVIRDIENGKTTRFIKIPWVRRCEYVADVGIALQLNEDLKPYLLGLKEYYTQYQLEEIMAMKSVYGIRLFEIILSKIMSSDIYVDRKYEVTISVQELRECCNCEESYPLFADFKKRVIEPAIKSINQETLYDISCSYQKKGKKVVAVDFCLISKYFCLRQHNTS